MFANCAVTISFFANMENVYSTAKKMKRKTGDKQKKGEVGPVTREVQKLAKECWPSEAVDALVEEAKVTLKKQQQPTLFSFGYKSSTSKPPSSPAPPKPSVDNNHNKKSTSVQAGPPKRKAQPENIIALAESLDVDNVALLSDTFAARGNEDVKAGGLAKLVRETDSMEKRIGDSSKTSGHRVSAFKKARVTYHHTRDKVKSMLQEISGLMDLEEIPGETRVENYQRMGPRITRANELKGELKDLLPDFKKDMMDWRRRLQVRRPMVEVEADDMSDRLTVENYSELWFNTMEKLDRKFNEAEELSLMTGNSREVTIGGFTKEIYRRLNDFFCYQRAIGSEYLTVAQVVTALGLQPNTSRQLLTSMKKYLPVGELRINWRKVLVDCELMRRRPDLVAKITILMQDKFKKRPIPEKQRVSKPVKQKQRQKRLAFHQKHPASLELARNLIMTGLTGDEEAVAADSRRRTECGMAAVKIKDILATMRTLLPKNEVPSYLMLRRWMSAPASNRKASGKYYNLIPAKIAVKVFTVHL